MIGVFLGYFALSSHDLEVVLLAVSAGFFLQIVMHDLLPKPSQHETSSLFLSHVLLVLVGALLMGSIANALGESHSHEAGDHAVSGEEHHEDVHKEAGIESGV
jgi:zinc transporter ZupT